MCPPTTPVMHSKSPVIMLSNGKKVVLKSTSLVLAKALFGVYLVIRLFVAKY